MGLFGRLARLIRANFDELVGDGGDREKMLDKTIAEMAERLVDMKNLVAASVAQEARTAGAGQQTERLEQQKRTTADLKRALALLNDKLEEAKTRRDSLRLRDRSARVADAVHASTSGVETENVTDLLDRLETQVGQLEMQVRVAAELEQPASEREAAQIPVARLGAREVVARALGPVSEAPGEGEERTSPTEPGKDERTGR